MRHSSETPNAWRTTPRKIVVVFLLAVFFIFASFGFMLDAMDMGRQPVLRFALSVLLMGLFAITYAVSGLTLRGRFWIAFLPILTVQSLSMGVLGSWLPDGPALLQMNALQLQLFQHRLLFDGTALMVSVVLGYTGFLIVSIAEARRRIRLQSEKSVLEGELSAAREIQRVMVPDRLPPTPGYAIESVYVPATQVGGDFFQVIPLSDGSTLVVVGDVSGKGLRAAMVVSMIVGALRVISSVQPEPAQILSDLNSRLIESSHGGFVTCLAARLDRSGSITVASAGHLSPWLNRTEVALPGCVPLSVVPEIRPEQTVLQMHPGDRLTLLTDGIVEARDAQGALFGFDRTQALIDRGATAQVLADAALHHGQEDDLTVIAISRIA